MVVIGYKNKWKIFVNLNDVLNKLENYFVLFFFLIYIILFDVRRQIFYLNIKSDFVIFLKIAEFKRIENK